MQSSFKSRPPSFVEEIQRDLRATTMQANHIILMGYSLPQDDVTYRAFFSASCQRPKGPTDKQVRCTVIGNLWTLSDPKRFAVEGNYSQIEFTQAMKENEMASLGDYSIGTTYPLKLRHAAAMDKPRTISAEGRVEMTIGAVEISAAGSVLEDKTERNIALYLMLYGSWQYDGGRIELDESGLPVAAVHTSAPEEPTPGQGFEIVGSVSSLYSQHYNSLTL